MSSSPLLSWKHTSVCFGAINRSSSFFYISISLFSRFAFCFIRQLAIIGHHIRTSSTFALTHHFLPFSLFPDSFPCWSGQPLTTKFSKWKRRNKKKHIITRSHTCDLQKFFSSIMLVQHILAGASTNPRGFALLSPFLVLYHFTDCLTLNNSMHYSNLISNVTDFSYVFSI